MNKKTILSLVILCIIVVGGITVYFLNPFKESIPDNESKDVIRVEGDFVYDFTKPNEVIGDADYVFIGYIEKYIDTTHKYSYSPAGKKFDDPYTNYSVTILENIKGDLKTNEPIPMQKFGGIKEDGKTIQLLESDELPEQGKMYIIMAYAQEDGSLLIYGPNSNIELETNINKNNFNKSNIVKQYKEAFINQVAKNRKSYKSIYEN